MTDTWLAERLHVLADTPGPTAPPITSVIVAGRHARRRRQRAIAAGVSATLTVAALAGVLSTRHHGEPTTLRVATAPDDGLHADYWFARDTPTDFAMKDGMPFATTYPATDTWYGNKRSSVTATESDGKLTDVNSSGGYSSSKFNLSISWPALWSAPTDPAGLRAWIQENRDPGSTNGFNLAMTIQQMLAQPAPPSLREGLVALLGSLPRATKAMGTDESGRTALITTIAQAVDSEQVSVTYTDPDSATLLETGYRIGSGVPVSATNLPAGHLDFYDVFTDIGPVATAPAVPTTKPSPELIVPNATGTPTCTPGKADDPTNPIGVQLAKICLPDPAPGFPFRRSPDSYGDAVARGFVVQTTATGGDSVKLQIAGNDQFFLSLASTPKPDGKGKVGDDTFVASVTVVGETASEVTDADGNRGIIVEKNGLGIEAMGSRTTTYAAIKKLIDSVEGISPA